MGFRKIFKTNNEQRKLKTKIDTITHNEKQISLTNIFKKKYKKWCRGTPHPTKIQKPNTYIILSHKDQRPKSKRSFHKLIVAHNGRDPIIKPNAIAATSHKRISPFTKMLAAALTLKPKQSRLGQNKSSNSFA